MSPSPADGGISASAQEDTARERADELAQERRQFNAWLAKESARVATYTNATDWRVREHIEQTLLAVAREGARLHHLLRETE